MKGIMQIPLRGPVFEKYKALLRNVCKELIPCKVSDEKVKIEGESINLERVAYSLTGGEVQKVLQGTGIRLIASHPKQLEVVFHGGLVWEQRWHGFVEFVCYWGEENVQKAGLPKVSRPFFMTEADELESALLTPDDPMYSMLTEASPKEMQMHVNEKGVLEEVSVPQEGWINLNNLFHARLQWLRIILLECDEAIERMIQSVRAGLDLPGGKMLGFLPFFDVWGHIAQCFNSRCSEFHADWQIIVHLIKYDSWDALYERYKATFNKWGIRK